jgi:hypothetical protein
MKYQNFVTELDSFVKKLWKAGVTAHLDIDAHAGTAWFALCVQFSQVPGSVQFKIINLICTDL